MASFLLGSYELANGSQSILSNRSDSMAHKYRNESLEDLSSSSSGPCSCILDNECHRERHSSYSSTCTSLGLQSDFSGSGSREILSRGEERCQSNLSLGSSKRVNRPSTMPGKDTKTSALSCPASPTASLRASTTSNGKRRLKSTHTVITDFTSGEE
ncbi:hypothetical protein Ciccas_007712 [Cichlidogyrus casuarinus]|uniref:Uncharacterized protein n=1 Tax=Cichlidogyrus casuarinus TaxID=1844966 RepID=A0ABD2Q2R8_9PLAT